MVILGIGGLLGDAAAAVLRDGELIAAVEESKLVRHRAHWRGAGEMPERAIATCLELAGAKAGEVDTVPVGRPLPRSGPFSLQLRAAVPNRPMAGIAHQA